MFKKLIIISFSLFSIYLPIEAGIGSDQNLIIKQNLTNNTLTLYKHEITHFQGNKNGAVSITFDDGYASQATIGVPLLNARNIKGTFFMVTASWALNNIPWDTLNQMANQGHEIGGHTVDHYDLTSITESDLRWQLSESQRLINLNIPAQSCVSFAYPYGLSNETVRSVTGEYYFAARGTGSPEGGYLNYYEDGPNWRAVNFLNVGSRNSDNINIPDIDFYLNAAEERHAWFSIHFHTIQNATAFGQLLDHLLTRNVWIGTFGSVVRYMRERLASTVNILSESNTEIKLNLTNSLDHSIYIEPLTIRSTIPPHWRKVQVQQGAYLYTVDSILEGAETVIYYNIIPNNGTITLTFLEGGPIEMVSTPLIPSGPASGFQGISYAYSTGGSSSNLGHTVEYQFDWKGDGTRILFLGFCHPI